jgi:small subunit ribosomal protein S18
MARSTERSTRRRATSPARRTTLKSCALCQDKVEWVDYKNITMLRRYMSDRGKIRARQATGNCAQHQGEISVAIKTARELVLLPYAQRTVTQRSDGRERGRVPRASAPAEGPGPGPTVSSSDEPAVPTARPPRNITDVTAKSALSEPLEMAGATGGGRS